MSELGFPNMFEDVLAEVFKRLDPESLENVIQVSKQWNEVAERSGRFPLRLTNKNLEASLASHRKFDKIYIARKTRLDHRMVDFFVKHGKHIRNLSVHGFTMVMENATIIYQMLETMPKLRRIIDLGTSEVQNLEDIGAELSLPPLPKLKTIHLCSQSFRLMRLFEGCQLQSLWLSKLSPNRVPMLNFLATQQRLEELVMETGSGHHSPLFETPIPAEFIPFHLKKLTIMNFELRETANDYQNLMEFMELHVKTLEELRLLDTFPEYLFEFVFAKFKQLKKLSFTGNDLPRDTSFYQRLKVNTSVTSLELESDVPLHSKGHTRALMDFIDHLPNIETLKLARYFDESSVKLYRYAAKNMKKLKKLIIEGDEDEDKDENPLMTLDDLQFHGLESLCLHSKLHINWYAFTKANPGIKELTIGPEQRRNLDLLDVQSIARNLRSLRQLTIECDICCDHEFFDIIRNCQELQSLKVDIESLQVDVSSVADIKCLRFANYF